MAVPCTGNLLHPSDNLWSATSATPNIANIQPRPKTSQLFFYLLRKTKKIIHLGCPTWSLDRGRYFPSYRCEVESSQINKPSLPKNPVNLSLFLFASSSPPEAVCGWITTRQCCSTGNHDPAPIAVAILLGTPHVVCCQICLSKSFKFGVFCRF